MPRPMAVGGERAVMHLDEMPGRRQSGNPVTTPYAASPREPSYMGQPGLGRRSSISEGDGRAAVASAPGRRQEQCIPRRSRPPG